MNPVKQFWALVKFQALVNPSVFFYLFTFFGMPFWLARLNARPHDYHPGLEILLMNENLFFVGFIGVMVLAPEIFRYGAAAALWTSGTEFVLTRAVDRPIWFRARTTFYYALVLIVPLLTLATAFAGPELKIDEYNRAAHEEILAQIPDSIAGPVDRRGVSTEITLPTGNRLVAGWHLAAVLLAAVGTQILIALIYPLKYRRWFFWSIYSAVLFGQIFILNNHPTRDESSPEELAFYYFVGHEAPAWVALLLAILIAQFWYERRMCRMEP